VLVNFFLLERYQVHIRLYADRNDNRSRTGAANRSEPPLFPRRDSAWQGQLDGDAGHGDDRGKASPEYGWGRGATFYLDNLTDLLEHGLASAIKHCGTMEKFRGSDIITVEVLGEQVAKEVMQANESLSRCKYRLNDILHPSRKHALIAFLQRHLAREGEAEVMANICTHMKDRISAYAAALIVGDAFAKHCDNMQDKEEAYIMQRNEEGWVLKETEIEPNPYLEYIEEKKRSDEEKRRKADRVLEGVSNPTPTRNRYAPPQGLEGGEDEVESVSSAAGRRTGGGQK
jgi:hypothetical protein